MYVGRWKFKPHNHIFNNESNRKTVHILKPANDGQNKFAQFIRLIGVVLFLSILYVSYFFLLKTLVSLSCGKFTYKTYLP